MTLWLWIAFAVLILALVLLSVWQVRSHAPVPLPALTKALLLSPTGQLESLRLLHGTPPQTIVCGAGRYRRDVTASGDHAVYRRDA